MWEAQPPPQFRLEQERPSGPDDILIDSQSQDHIFQNPKFVA